MSPADVHADLGAVVARGAPGRTSDDEITIFDSTGMALQDVAAAIVTWQRAIDSHLGLPIDLAS